MIRELTMLQWIQLVPAILTNATATARFADDSDIELLVHAILVIGTLEDWAMKNLQLL